MRKVVVAVCTLILTIGVMGFTRADAAPICRGLLSPVESLIVGAGGGAVEPVFAAVSLVDGIVLGAAGMAHTLC